MNEFTVTKKDNSITSKLIHLLFSFYQSVSVLCIVFRLIEWMDFPISFSLGHKGNDSFF